jgi:predicted transcriptional regulator
MSVLPEIEAIEAKLKDAGASVTALCAAADVNQSTWTRWKSGKTVPNMATWQKVNSAFKSIVGRKEDAA